MSSKPLETLSHDAANRPTNSGPINSWFLRLAIAGCFLGHGTLALKNASIFYSQWSTWVQSLFPASVQYEYSQVMLESIGTIDILVAISFLIPRIPLVSFAWAIGWGTLTALSRIYFLGRLDGPISQNMIGPFGEFLVRTPNFLVPILLFKQTFADWNKLPYVNNLTVNHFLKVAIITQMLGLFCHYISEFSSFEYPYEILKHEIPLWFFHGKAIITVGALIGFAMTRVHSSSLNITRAAAILSFLAYVSTEGFEVFMLNVPQGFTYTAIRFVEHFPIYLCVLLFLKDTLQTKSSLQDQKIIDLTESTSLKFSA